MVHRASASALIAALALAACGSSGSNSSHPNNPSKKSVGLAGKTPAQIVAAAQAALRSASGYVATGAITQHGKMARLQIVDAGPTKLKITLTQGGTTAEIIVLSGIAYMHANAAFWTPRAGSAATGLLANRWIQLPAGGSQQLTSGLGRFAPSTLARCLGGGADVGTLSRDGTTTVDGKPALVIRDAGNAPGDHQGTLAVATIGPPYPLRLTSTGRRHPGGKVDACHPAKRTNAQGSLTLRDFSHAPSITAPTDPLKLPASGSPA